MSPQKIILVTGASMGIGWTISDHLAKHGHIVFGTSRDPQKYSQPTNWSLLRLDVRSSESAEGCVRSVLEKAGTIDVLINNAGYGFEGALEEATCQQASEHFETNYFGMFRMIKAVLPIMRGKSQGRIINISAGNASIRLPFMGHYTATKCAMEALSETLRREVKPFGIHVSFLEPGFFRSNIINTAPDGEDRIEDYEPWRTAWIELYRDCILHGPDPEPVAKCVLRILEDKRPHLFYRVGSGMGFITLAHRLLPEDLFSRAAYSSIRKTFSKDDRK